jgi:DNA processing protein
MSAEADAAPSTDPVPIASELPDEAWVVALASLDGMGPARLGALLRSHDHPKQAWDALVAGAVSSSDAVLADVLGPNRASVAAAWTQGARLLNPAACWARHVEAGVGVAIRSSPSYPAAFADDPEPPAVVFAAGDPDAVVGPRVAIVGTRDCTRYGHDVARQLGAELAEAGVAVVSGLAVGIDGAAHSGALDVDGAAPIAVVGSGLDVVYPRRHRSLWQRVVERGVVLSEYPLGSAPVAWHFPARNRLIAALADVVVVVESQERGGSLHTVDEANRRDVDVMAVPGPVTSPSSSGTNRLLADGAAVARDATDVLVHLGLGSGSRRTAAEHRPPPTAADQAVLDSFDWQPAVLDQLALRTGLVIDEVAVALDRLERGGWIEHRGGWYERRAKPERAGGRP